MNHSFHRFSRHAIWALAFVMLGLLAVQPAMISFAAGIDDSVWWAGNLHDSRDPLYRTPVGPVPVGTDVTLRLRTDADDLTSATVRVWNDRQNSESFLNMVKVASDGTHDWWEATLDTGAVPNVFWYRFFLTDGGDTDFYEDDSRKWGGIGEMFDDSPDNSWAITVYDPAFQTPQWVKDAVFYQVFVDRFNDGSSANNNTPDEFFYDEADGTIVRSNGTDWNTPVCDPRATSGTTCDGSYSRNFYGGDLQGIIDKLDYLQDLGVTALYLNPIFESPSNHKYDTSDFSVIDDNFGTLADFQNLVAQAELRGMKIVLDGVFNHTSSQSPYFDRYEIHTTLGACESTASEYAPMYHFTENDPTPTCSDNRDYPYWFGIFDSLPVLDSGSNMARDMVWGAGITHPIGGAKDAVAKYWIDQGAAGWRLDVAPEIDHGVLDGNSDYWENFRAAVHSVDPEAYIVGEEWGYSMSWTSGGADGGVMFPDGNPGEWDATMNYQQSAALLSLWRDTPLNAENDFNTGSSAGLLEPYSPSMFVERYLNLKERYSPEAFAAMMNLLGSHDTQRALWLLDHGHPVSPTAGTVHPPDASYDWSDAINRLHGVALMQFTLPGAPQIYYGDEVGLVGQSRFDGSSWQDDPYNRQPFPWLDETGTPFFAHLQSEPAQGDNYYYYALLTATRNAHVALRTGEIDFALVDDANKKLAYLRWMADGSDAAVVLVNRNSVAQDFAVDLGGKVAEGATFDNALTEGVVEAYAVTGGMLNITGVPAMGGALLVRTSAAVLIPPAVALTGEFAGAQVNLNWTASSGATVYDVYRSTLSGAMYTLLGSTAALTYSDAVITVPEQYYYIVVARDETHGLESDSSNEAFVVTGYDLSLAYLNVQWPPSLIHTISTENPTAVIYAQIWLGGVTDASISAISGIQAQVGYGPDGSDPTVDASAWTWFDMEHNLVYDFSANNDEFHGQMLPTALGTYRYTVRYSGDGGITWLYATDFDGDPRPDCPDKTENPANNFAKCMLTVQPSSDMTAPTAPVAAKEFDTSGAIGISWSGATDETALSGYRIYRSEEGGAVELLAALDNAAATYTDSGVTAGNDYAYTVRAFDTSFNESSDSNTVLATAENSLVDVTFTVTVPGFTPGGAVIQVIGGVPQLTTWGAGVDMTATANPNEYDVTLQIPENSSFEYKYRRDGSWDMGEKQANGYDEVANRPYTVGYAEDGPYTIADMVVNWRDVLVSATDPADDATAVPITSVVTVGFNKTVNTASEFDMLDAASQPVAGSFTVDNSAVPAITFDPTADLCPATTYTVNVSDVNAAGDGQQFQSYSFDFTTAAVTDMAVTFTVTVPNFTPVGDTIYISGNHAALGNDVPNAIAMTSAGGNQWTYTASLPVGGSFTYTYTRDSAETQATAADGETLFSGTVNVASGCEALAVSDTVENWVDPIVLSTSPVDGATQQALNTPISVTFSKPVDPASTFEVLDSDNQTVAGSFVVDNSTAPTITFTPASDLGTASTYTVNVSGVNGEANGQQSGSYSFSFSTDGMIAVTFSVTVPPFTPVGDTIYISGSHTALGSDVFNAVAMTNAGGSLWTYTAAIPANTVVTYTYSRGSANTQATGADGETLFSGAFNFPSGSAASQTISDTVENWVDPIVVSTSPVDGATQQALNTTISVMFSKPVNPASTFTVQGSDAQPITGSFTYDGTSNTLGFTPAANYPIADTITVNVSGVTGAVSGTQVEDAAFSFKTPHLELLRNWNFDAKPAKKKLKPWVLINGTGDKLVCDATKTYSGECAFKFKGSKNENSKLVQVVNISGLTFAPGDELILSAFANSALNVNLKLILSVKYNDVPLQRKQVRILTTSGYAEYTVPTLVLNSANVKSITVKFKHKSKSGRTFIDDVGLKLRQGNARRGAEMILPLPNIPSGFRGN